MNKYRVVLTKTQILDSREIEAENEKEAIDKTFMTFNKCDRNDYDNIEVDLLDADE